MGTHVYYDAGPRTTRTRTNVGGAFAIPVTTEVEIHDGADHVMFAYTDLDALDETCRMFEEARANHVAAICDGRSEMVDAASLEPDDLAVIDGELVCVESVVISGTHGETVTVRYGKKYQGAYDMTAGRAITCRRTERVKRLTAGATLTAVV